MKPPFLAALLLTRLPFYYGWVVLGCVCLAGFARQGPAVAVLSIFVVPMTAEFGWSRLEIAGAVSLGGLMAAVVSPLLGPLLDRRGARLVLCLALLGTGLACMALSLVASLLGFYLLFCFARMIFAGPFDLGLYGALNNWFVARRARANSIAKLAQLSGLVALPVIAQFAMNDGGADPGGNWRAGWIAVGATVLILGLPPCWLLLVRRPEDAGLAADPRPPGKDGTPPAAELQFSRAEAMRTRAFWLLALFTVLVYPVQAGVSLHQAAHLIERGLPALAAATAIGVFSASSAVASFAVGFLPHHWGPRGPMMAGALLMALGSAALIGVASAEAAYLAAAVFGLGLGAAITPLPVAWADYFGRESYGAIRGVVLAMQVVAQAVGPVLSGLLRDVSGDYTLSLIVFAALAALGVAAAAMARRPG